jgi:riboflavin kinase/FMN adenylyltransferase
MQLLKPEECRYPLSLPKEQELELESIGMDDWIREPFSQKVREETPIAFIERLTQSMSLQAIVVGPDFRFGKNREGDVNLLQAWAPKFGFQVLIPEPYLCQGQRVSSSLVRQALLNGDVERAEVFLGRPYALSGKVVSGFRRGRTIGFPTANIINLCAHNLRLGVYYTLASLNGKRWKAATNIGLHPTVEESSELQVESHLLDFSENIYGEELKIEFVKFIRPELKFKDIESLRAQIEEDIQIVRES